MMNSAQRGPMEPVDSYPATRSRHCGLALSSYGLAAAQEAIGGHLP
jgi:hypothetical protein